jgi:hypothetical protein
MRFKSGWSLAGMGAAAALLSFVTALEVQISVTPALGGIGPPSINRGAKSDRLPVVLVSQERWRAPQPRLPDGCIAASDWRSGLYTAEIAGRCVG